MSNNRIALIGGTGLDVLQDLAISRRHQLQTAYGSPSAAIQEGKLYGHSIFFLPRHGDLHQLPPHKINYRANIAALAKLNVNKVLAITAVGGIAKNAAPRSIVIPDQVIDYTHGREHTFFDGVDATLEHIDFTWPFCRDLRSSLIGAADRANIAVTNTGVYGATQGPRLETAAEISKLANDGCSIVGMTAMPEAALARELNLRYANCSVVVNWGAGIEQDEITMDDIRANLTAAHGNLKRLLAEWLKDLGSNSE